MLNNQLKIVSLSLGLLAMAGTVRADEFTDADLKRWEQQFMGVVADVSLFSSPPLVRGVERRTSNAALCRK